jgi:HSP20 family protein
MNTLIRYEEPVSVLSSWLDDVVNDGYYFNRGRELIKHQWPNVDIVEQNDTFEIHAELPGLDKNDIAIKIENGVLSISGEKKQEKKEKEKGKYYYYERSYGTFNRTFALPDNVDENAIEAQFKNGLLTLTLKKTEKAKPKTIEVKVE